MPYANNKGADQPAHPRSLISAFVVRCLDSIISLVSIICNFMTRWLLLRSMPVWVLPGRKTQRQVFSWRGSVKSLQKILTMGPIYVISYCCITVHASRLDTIMLYSRYPCSDATQSVDNRHLSSYRYCLNPVKRTVGQVRRGIAPRKKK